MNGDDELEAVLLVPAVAFMRKSERWLEVGETAAVDHAAVDEWVGVLRPEDQVSISECTLFGKKSGMLSGSVKSRVTSSISSSTSRDCASAVDDKVGTLVVVVVVVACNFFVDGLYEDVDTFSTKTGVGDVLKTGEFSLSSSLSSSSEHAVLCGTLFVPPLKSPWLVCALLRLLTGPAEVDSWSSAALMIPIPSSFFFDAERGLYPAAW